MLFSFILQTSNHVDYPGVQYYWSRDYFPNFVQEDQRVFVSHDGALYFSALEIIDRANYSCTVQSLVSSTGRNGPFFQLRVNPHPNYQDLIFANSFPKLFPSGAIAGTEIRLECMAFGYPVCYVLSFFFLFFHLTSLQFRNVIKKK